VLLETFLLLVIFMKNKTNKFTAFVGVDWADCKHDISIVSATGGKPVHQVIIHTPEALSEWLAKVRQQYPEGQIAICLEQSKGALIFHLLGYDFLTLFPINPNPTTQIAQECPERASVCADAIDRTGGFVAEPILLALSPFPCRTLSVAKLFSIKI